MTTINIDDARTEAESALQIEFDKQEFTSTATCVQIVLDAALPHLTPRTITTLAEWIQAPYGTIALGARGEVILNEDAGRPYGFMPYRLGGIHNDIEPELPLTVLHTPTTVAGEV